MASIRYRLSRLTLLPSCLVAASALALIDPASAVPSYNIVPLGFDDLEHTNNDGYKLSNAVQLNAAGQVIGSSDRYSGGFYHGASAWLYDGATTINIGLTGSEHTTGTGAKSSAAVHLNAAGQVLGISGRYNGGNDYLGRSVWLYNGATTINIGLTGAEHTGSDGYKSSDALQLNEAGLIAGTATRYNEAGHERGISAWLYNGTNTIDIGLVGIEHTASYGFKRNIPDQINGAGQVRGTSYRYNGGSTWLGQSAWLYNGATTIDIGLTGAQYTRNDGFKSSETIALNAAGQVLGNSARYDGAVNEHGTSAWLYSGGATIGIGLTDGTHTATNGAKVSSGRQLNHAGQVVGISHRFDVQIGYSQSAWFFDGATTVNIGLTDSEHTHANSNYKYSDVYGLNEAGQVIGSSERLTIDGINPNIGRSAWIYDGANTIKIGLTGPGYTSAGGHKISEAWELNEAGYVMGISRPCFGGSCAGSSAWFYNGTTTIEIGRAGPEHDGYSQPIEMNNAGQVRGTTDRYSGFGGSSAWVYNGTTTIDIGLKGAQHTRNDGYKNSYFGNLYDQLNEVGQIIGVSQRFNGGSTELGQDAWVYDSVLDHTFSLQLSLRSDGYAYSKAEYLGEDGLVLGTYTLFDVLNNDLGNRAFYFTIADGMHDLGPFVEGGLTANGWDYLASAVRINGRGQILGHGKLTSQSSGQMPYLLTPNLPGDFNHDGTVDAADYVVWRKQSGTPAQYAIWRANFGQPGSGAGATAPISAIPEPAGVATLLMALVASLAIGPLKAARRRRGVIEFSQRRHNS